MLALPDFLRSPVVVADVRVDVDDLLTLQLEDQTQDAVGPGVVGAEVEDHRLVVPLQAPALEEVAAVAGNHGGRRLGGVGGHLGAAEGMVLAQGVALPGIGHEDAAQVGVAGEADAEHVVDLPLVPVGGRPDAGDRGRLRFLFAQGDLYPEVAGILEGQKVVDEGEVVPRGLAAAGSRRRR